MMNRFLCNSGLNREVKEGRSREMALQKNCRRAGFFSLLGPALFFSLSLGAQSPVTPVRIEGDYFRREVTEGGNPHQVMQAENPLPAVMDSRLMLEGNDPGQEVMVPLPDGGALASPRERNNVPYPLPEVILKSGNLTSKSAIDIKGITNQFVLFSGVDFNPDYECVTTYPFNTVNYSIEYERTQMLFLASELGPAPKTLNYLELARKVTGTSTVTNFTVRLKHTSISNFSQVTSGYADMTGAQTVFNDTDGYTIPSGSGTCGSAPNNDFTWMKIDFNSGFVYNGTDNLIVEIYWGPVTSGTSARAVLAGDYPEERVIYGYSGSASPERDGSSIRRPNMRFGYQIPTFGTPSQLAAEVFKGCIAVSNVSFSGDNRAIGYFERRADNPNFPFERGIVLSTGQVSDAAGPNSNSNKSTQLGTPGDPDITTLAGATSFDAASLTVNFVPNAESVSFNYIFASEEYPEWACSDYNDAFGFFISGPGITRKNIALLSDGETVEIHTIRVGGYDLLASNTACRVPESDCCDDAHESLYISIPPGELSIEADGRTVPLMAVISGLDPCSTYTMKFVIGDANDSKGDSFFFLQGDSFGAASDVDFENLNDRRQSTNNLFMSCNGAFLKVKRDPNGDLSEAVTVPVTLGGTAIHGTHYAFTGITPVDQVMEVTIPAGQSFAEVPYTLLDTPLPGGMASISFSTAHGCTCSGSVTTQQVTLYDTYSFNSVTPTPVASCSDADGTIGVNLGLSAPLNLFSFTYVLKNPEGTSLASFSTAETSYSFTGLDEGTYVVEVYDDVSCTVLTQGGLVVSAPGQPVVTCRPDISMCLNASPLVLDGSLPSGGVYGGPGVTGGIFYPAAAGVGNHLISYLFTDPATSCSNNCFFTVTVLPEPVLVSAGVTSPVVCHGGTATVTLVVSGGTAPLTYTFNGISNTTGVFPGVAAGTDLSFSVNDAGGCGPVTGTLTVTQPEAPLECPVAVISEPTCPECSDGEATVTPAGGWGNYSYRWSDGQTNATATGLTAGTWTVTVTDTEGCIAVAEVTFNPQPDITVTISATPNIFNGETIFNVVVKITEVNGVRTSGPISVVLPKDERWSLDGNYDPMLTNLDAAPLNNSAWSYTSNDAGYHIFTSSDAILPGAVSVFGFKARFDPRKTKGIYTITGQIISGSGSENRVNNNADSEKLNYFAY